MSGKVVGIHGGNAPTEPDAVDDVLDGAREAGLSSVVLVGWNRKGNLYVAGSHSGDASLALMARASVWLAGGYDHGIDREDEGA